MKKLLVLNAGMSSPSSTRLLAERIAQSVVAQVSKRGEGLEVEYVNLTEYATDLATVMTTGIYTDKLREAMDNVTDAHAVVAATPIFAASYSGLFKMFIDTLDPQALTRMPVLIAATAGTPRHSLALEYAMRPLFAYMRAVVVPTAVFAATDDFGSDSEIEHRVNRAATELAEHIVSTNSGVVGFGPDYDSLPQRSSNTTINPEVRSFADLLKGHTG
ncbi:MULTISPECIES: FMN reductase [unclassified Corynebacterium]|uniref:FMN reductase n=1 Tax=unclassified Corynebacterium TaxID=2624378 RepID=UPI00216A1785|nr:MULTISPECIES: FMN reductase [unclassified Corynebacterium]MCS4489081.1 FMN reductase [Corynebacterium sp. ES2775-CONJ]MCS4531223.1 FMN reductase [Corynebacterium sp. ES2730-CONJ]